MKILLINKYLYPKGGADKITISTGELLQQRGHQVSYWGMSHPDNPPYSTSKYFTDCIDYSSPGGILQQLNTAAKFLYSFEAKSKVERLIREEKPDIVHLHNFAHELSPSILSVFKKHNIPMVMTLHDYQLVCPTYSMVNGDKPCEACDHGKYYRCVIKKCAKNSYVKSLLNALEMYLHHNILHSYDKIDVFAPSSIFLKDKVTQMGFKGDMVQIPNFVDPKDFTPSYSWDGKNIVYFGRLSKEKGIATLVEAVNGLDVELNIIGNGPQREELESIVAKKGMKNVHFLGFRNGDDLYNIIKNSMFIVVPSQWYENYPRAIVEAFALGKPAIGSRNGGIPELINDPERGLLFTPGDSRDLREKLLKLINAPESIVSMGKNARRLIEAELNPDKQYETLMKIYGMAIDKRRKKQ